jgi:hypothetical protein
MEFAMHYCASLVRVEKLGNRAHGSMALTNPVSPQHTPWRNIFVLFYHPEILIRVTFNEIRNDYFIAQGQCKWHHKLVLKIIIKFQPKQIASGLVFQLQLR